MRFYIPLSVHPSVCLASQLIQVGLSSYCEFFPSSQKKKRKEKKTQENQLRGMNERMSGRRIFHTQKYLFANCLSLFFFPYFL